MVLEKIMLQGDADAKEQVCINGLPPENAIDILFGGLDHCSKFGGADPERFCASLNERANM